MTANLTRHIPTRPSVASIDELACNLETQHQAASSSLLKANMQLHTATDCADCSTTKGARVAPSSEPCPPLAYHRYAILVQSRADPHKLPFLCADQCDDDRRCAKRPHNHNERQISQLLSKNMETTSSAALVARRHRHAKRRSRHLDRAHCPTRPSLPYH